MAPANSSWVGVFPACLCVRGPDRRFFRSLPGRRSCASAFRLGSATVCHRLRAIGSAFRRPSPRPVEPERNSGCSAQGIVSRPRSRLRALGLDFPGGSWCLLAPIRRLRPRQGFQPERGCAVCYVASGTLDAVRILFCFCVVAVLAYPGGMRAGAPAAATCALALGRHFIGAANCVEACLLAALLPSIDGDQVRVDVPMFPSHRLVR